MDNLPTYHTCRPLKPTLAKDYLFSYVRHAPRIHVLAQNVADGWKDRGRFILINCIVTCLSLCDLTCHLT